MQEEAKADGKTMTAAEMGAELGLTASLHSY